MMTLQKLIPKMCALFPEREEPIKGLAVATCAQQHPLLLGPPGTGKTLMTSIFASCLDASYFEILLGAFSVPEDLFGPLSIKGIEQDEYRRNNANFATNAQVVYLDEVFKANGGILNSGLALLNERKFYQNGQKCQAPLMTCVGSSNELHEGDALNALYDRFMLRYVVNYLSDRDAFMAMLKAPEILPPGKIDLAAEQLATRAVKLTSETYEAIADLQSAHTGAGHRASDRRWRNSLGLIQANAHLSGRTETSVDDLEILEHVLWNKPDERATVQQIVQKIISPDGARAVQELDAAKEIFKKLPQPGTLDGGKYIAAVGDANQAFKSILTRLNQMSQNSKVAQAKAQVAEMQAQVAKLALTAAGF